MPETPHDGQIPCLETWIKMEEGINCEVFTDFKHFEPETRQNHAMKTDSWNK